MVCSTKYCQKAKVDRLYWTRTSFLSSPIWAKSNKHDEGRDICLCSLFDKNICCSTLYRFCICRGYVLIVGIYRQSSSWNIGINKGCSLCDACKGSQFTMSSIQFPFRSRYQLSSKLLSKSIVWNSKQS